MEEKDFKWHKPKVEDVSIYANGDQIDGRLLRGRAVYNEPDQRLTIVENSPRTKRSVEVGRGAHGRCVRRPDGNYTYTFHFTLKEKYLVQTLQAELRDVVNGLLKK